MIKLLLTIIILLPTASLAEDVEKVESKSDKLIAAVKSNKIFSLENLALEVSSDPTFKKMWSGALPVTEASVDYVELGFTSEDEGKKPFKIYLEFSEDKLIIKHSLAVTDKGGLRVDPAKRDWQLYLHGIGRTGVRVAVPKASKDVYGVLICPRDFTKIQSVSSRAKNLRADTNYLSDKASFKASAFFQGAIKSGLDKSLVKGEILVSETIEQPTRASDFSYARYPDLEIKYQPQKTGEVEDGNQAFINLIGVLHNSAGYKLESNVLDQVAISTVEIEKDVLKPLSQKKVLYNFTAGKCASVIKWRRIKD
ncbi:MAG: hypothetical protein R3A13_07215 [Bdellovibrionota bacterium]